MKKKLILIKAIILEEPKSQSSIAKFVARISHPFVVKRHILSVHEKKKPFSCDKCPKCFALKDELRKHRESVHKETTYPCTQCDKVLDSNIILTRHIKTVHEEQRIDNEITLERNQSDVVIDYQSDVITTKATNLEEKDKQSKFNCKVCGKNFASATIVKRHISTVHEQNKPFICDKCPKCFGLKVQLRKHRETIHENKTYPCFQCDKEFKSKQTLTIHIKTVHEGQRINVCEYCNKAYGYKSDLLWHLDTKHKQKD